MILEKEDSYIKLTATFSTVYGILLVVASVFPSPYVWGIRLIEFISIPSAMFVFSLIVAARIPTFRRLIISAVDDLVRVVQHQHIIVRYAISFFVVALLVIMFWMFRQSLHFLGDGYLLIRNLEFLNWYSDINIIYKNEPLSGLITVSIHRLLVFFNPDTTTEFSIQIVSIFFGIGAIGIAYKIFRQFTDEISIAVFAVVCFLSTATTQLYVGYVENYSPVVFFLLLFLLVGIRFMKTGKYYISVVICYSLLFFSHYSMLCLFPAFIFIGYHMVKREKIIELLLSVILGMVLLAVLISITYYPRSAFFERFISSSNHLLPLFGHEGISFSYPLISLRHIVDSVNQYIFVFPFLMPLSVLFFKITRRLKVWKERTTLFFIIAAVCTFVFGFLAKSDLGLSRDWDLFSIFLVPAIMIVVIGILKIERLENQKQILLIIILTSFAHTGTWIYINSNRERSFNYFNTLPNEQLWSKKSNANAHDVLARYCAEHQEYEQSLYHYREYIKFDSTNSRIWENIGGTYFYVRKDTANAQLAYEKCVEYGRKSWVVFANLGEIYMKQQRYDSALVMVNRSLELNPGNDAAKNSKSFILARMKQK